MPSQAGSLDEFVRQRPFLKALSYRMLGSAADAEDVVQEVWLRWQSAGGEAAQPRAWLAAATTRLCIDAHRRVRDRRTDYVGLWLPEPIAAEPEPFDRESLSLAFLQLLEQLTPVERAVWLLHEVFSFSHAELGELLDLSEDAARQQLRRARQFLADARPRFTPERARHEEMLGRFLATVASGDLDALCALLARDAESWADGGGKAKAALKTIRGQLPVAKLLLGLTTKMQREPAYAGAVVSVEDFSGQPGLIFRVAGRVVVALQLETDGVLIHSIRSVLNPDKLTGL